MKTNIQQIKKHRVYSEEFRKELVTLYERGHYSVPQLEKLYGVSNPNIYRWIYRYSTFNEKGSRIVEMKTSSSNRLKDLESRIKDLEQMVGQKQIKIEYLEKMIDLAKEDLNIDIKKNCNTPQSTGSAKINKK